MSEKSVVTPFYYPTPSELEEIYERGYNYWNQGAFEHAAECFSELAIRNPLDRRFLFAFACALEQQGETLHALKLFLNVLTLKADDPFTYYHIACCFKTLGQIIEARDALDATIVLCQEPENNEFDYAALQRRATDLISDLNN